MVEGNDSYLVFVSHSGTDTWVAKQIAGHLEARGASVFLDQANIQVGAKFEKEIVCSLQRAKELLVLFTPWALECPYVWAELGAAWGREIPIIGLLHGVTAAELQGRPGIPVFIKQRDMINLNEIEIYLGQLRLRIVSEHQEETRNVEA